MLNSLLILIVLLAIGNLYPTIKNLTIVIKHGFGHSVLIPGPGLVIAQPVLLLLHIFIEVILITIAVLLFRYT
jgi:hypothetical protein